MLTALLPALAVVALVLGIGLTLRHLRLQVYGEALLLGGGEVLQQDLMANNLGLTSWGPAQLRGNGCLLLTTEALVFVQFTPRRSFVVPIEQITQVERVKTHLGKSVGRDLLKVHFASEGAPDSLAFSVADPAPWVTELERLQQGTGTTSTERRPVRLPTPQPTSS